MKTPGTPRVIPNAAAGCWVWLNDRLVRREAAVVSVFDRSFQYGDGLFETVLVRNNRPFRWERHLLRLYRGAEFLRIRLPLDSRELTQAMERLLRRNRMPDSALRVHLSRGVGVRGYSIRGAEQPQLVLAQHALPVETERFPALARLATATVRLPTHDRAALYKTANKLARILARIEAEQSGADEALLLNSDGEVAGAAAGNVFCVKGGGVFTPPLSCGVLAGVTRDVVFDLCRKLKLPCQEKPLLVETLRAADAVFLTQSIRGLVEVKSLDGHAFPASPVVRRLQRTYERLLRAATVG